MTPDQHPKDEEQSHEKGLERNVADESSVPTSSLNDIVDLQEDDSLETLLSEQTSPSLDPHRPAQALAAEIDSDREVIGPYLIQEELGRGGMGIVYRALDPRLDRPVAVKLLRARIAEDASWRQQLETEAKLLASINHPNIATLHSLEQSERHRYLTMEFVEGESLQRRLNAGPLPLDEALTNARQIASALEAAHQRSIVHCDLKPANVIQRSDGVVKVLDFGIARRPPLRAEKSSSGVPGSAQPGERESMSSAPAHPHKGESTTSTFGAGSSSKGETSSPLGSDSSSKGESPSALRAGSSGKGESSSASGPGSRGKSGSPSALGAGSSSKSEMPSPLGSVSPRKGESSSGTPGFMSPEQIRGDSIDHRSDLFAFGALVFESLTGLPAFPGANSTERMEATLRRKPAFERLPADTPDSLRHLIEQCLALDPASRPASSGDVRRILETEVAARRLAAHRAEARARSALPRPWTSFVGRDELVKKLVALVQAQALVTLTGFGGCGKTRLALQAADEVAPEFADGVLWVELTPLADGSLLWLTLARALELREAPQQAPEDAVLLCLENRASLIVLDNCEHIVAPVAAVVAAIRRRAPSIHVLTTTRERLALPGEHVFAVPLLTLPASGAQDLATIAAAEAVQLFSERALAAAPHFELTLATAPHVAEICRRLEGIPLAIELAAARLRVLGVQDLAQRLANRFQILKSSVKGTIAHHQTLEATVEWSHDLLSEDEATLLRRLSIFAGGWSLESAEEVCALDGIEGWQILDLLTGLVEKSLIEIDTEKLERIGATRYRMLETVREYASSKLRSSPEFAAIRRRHGETFLRVCEAAGHGLVGADEAHWRARFEMDLDNVRAVFLRGEEDPELQPLALELATQTGRCYDVLGAWSEGRITLQRVLDRDPATNRSFVHARVLGLIGNLVFNQGDLAEARRIQEQSLDILREHGHTEGIMVALGNLANVLTEQGEYERATEMYEENLRLAREIGNKWAEAAALGNISTALLHVDLERAEAATKSALAKFEELQSAWAVSFCCINLASILGMRGDNVGSQTAALRAVDIARELGDRKGLGLALQQIARNALVEERWEDSRVALAEALLHISGLGDQSGIVTILESAIQLAVHTDEYELGARFLGTANALRERLGMPRHPGDELMIVEVMSELAARLGGEAYAALHASVIQDPATELKRWLSQG